MVAAFAAMPWAMRLETLEAMASIFERAHFGERLSEGEVEAAIGARARPRGKPQPAVDEDLQAVAVVPIHGVIAHRAHMVEGVSSGAGTSTEILDQVIRAAVADPSIRSIVLDIDSPGGSVSGVAEVADTILRARARKPIAAVANSLAASAAYWIGTAAHELFVTPSGEVGSIGAYAAHTDFSKAEEAAGRKTTIISAGKYKTEGNPLGPLGDDAKAHMQARVDEYYTQFVRAVARHRGVSVEAVRNGYGQGRTLGAQAALAAGMVDGVRTLDDVIGRYAHRTLQTANAGNNSLARAQAQIAIAAAGWRAPVGTSAEDAARRVALAKASLDPRYLKPIEP